MQTETSNSNHINIEELLKQFSTGSLRKRRSLVVQIEQRVDEIIAIGPSVLELFDPDSDNWSAGWILQLLNINSSISLPTFFKCKSACWFNTYSSSAIDYAPLQKYLLAQSFEEADRFTSSKLRQLAGPDAENRGYVYFTEVESMNELDLITIDRLWTAYSQGRFGFSTQARLLEAMQGRYDKLWPRIGWKKDGVWTRYPGAFDWSMDAPEGHMPLVNQLRGVRLMDAILKHPALIKRRNFKV